MLTVNKLTSNIKDAPVPDIATGFVSLLVPAVAVIKNTKLLFVTADGFCIEIPLPVNITSLIFSNS